MMKRVKGKEVKRQDATTSDTRVWFRLDELRAIYSSPEKCRRLQKGGEFELFVAMCEWEHRQDFPEKQSISSHYMARYKEKIWPIVFTSITSPGLKIASWGEDQTKNDW